MNRFTRLGAFLLVTPLALAASVTPPTAFNPFGFLAPLVSVDSGERAKLDSGQPVVKVLRGGGGSVGVFGAVRIDVDGVRLVASTHALEHQRRSKYVAAIERFSDPPQLEDLDALTLDDHDFEDILRCKPGDCGLKLDAEEIDHLRRTVAAAGVDWKGRTLAAFRLVVLNRVRQYRAGTAAGATYHDHDEPVTLRAEFTQLIEEIPFLTLHLPEIAEYLQAYPHVPGPDGSESFIYWSKDVLAGRPILSVTHVTLIESQDRRRPEALVLSRQIFATHYTNASLGVTAVTHPTADAPRYLLYVNRSRTDLLDGPFAALIRGVIERRVRAEAPRALNELRRHLEARTPPDAHESPADWGTAPD